ncbi:MAG: diacylglycerol kinase family lipid kinase [Opitutus sp.]|nr:diacylglycerol kinase family lipid kinase [Opitutus sp.]
MKTCLIFNPAAGKCRRTPALFKAITRRVAESGLDVSVVKTRERGHATELARAAVRDGCTRIIAVGGDGTLNEIAPALIGTRLALGIVPAGSGNGLATHLGLPRDPLKALGLALEPASGSVAIDVGTVNDVVFVNTTGFGLDAEIASRCNEISRRSFLSYARTTWARFFQRAPMRVTIDSGARRVSLETLLVTVSNSDQYGHHACIAPGASVRDGLIDLVAVKPMGPLRAVQFAAQLMLGRLHTNPRTLRLRAREFTLERIAPGFLHTDGELHYAGSKLEVRVHPAALRIVTAPGTRDRFVLKRRIRQPGPARPSLPRFR